MTATSGIGAKFVERLKELFDGLADDEPVWVTSGGRDSSLHGSLEQLTAQQASRVFGQTTIAAHVGHLVFSIGMVNRWAEGQQPAGDWASSWSHSMVDDAEWDDLRTRLRHETDALLAGPASNLDWTDPEQANYGFTTLAHTAYHIGVIRHMTVQL